MDATACVIVTDASALGWLGHRTRVGWALAHLDDVRGLERVVCCAPQALLEPLLNQARDALGRTPDQVVLPDNRDAILVEAHLGAVVEGDALLFLWPRHPFLQPAKLEACLDALRTGADVARPARPVRCVPGVELDDRRLALPREFGAWAYLGGVRAVRRGARVQDRVVPIAVNPIEALDLADPDEAQIAGAVVDADAF